MEHSSTVAALGLTVACLALFSLARWVPEPVERVSPRDARAGSPAGLSGPPNPARPSPAGESNSSAFGSSGSDAVAALRAGRRIDLNAAAARDLELLPGIGPTLAQRIVADRTARGAFASASELVRVHGVGPKTASRVRHLLCVKTERTSCGKARHEASR